MWHDLGVREVLGRDENATITKLDQPDLNAVLRVTQIKVTGQPGNMQPLYFLIQYLFWPVVGRSAFMLRFLPSVFGVLVVVFSYKLGDLLFEPGTGLIGALFTTLLPLHVRYAQIARPYTLLALFGLASVYFLVRALETHRSRFWFGFVLTATLGFYTHYNALFVLLTEAIFAGVWAVGHLVARKKQRSVRGLAQAALGFLLVGLLCLPGLIRLLRLPWLGLDSGDGAAGSPTIELTIPFFRHFLYNSGIRTTSFQNLCVGLIVLGLVVTAYRRRWLSLVLASLWLSVPFAALALMRSPRPFEERYVIFLTPMAMLLMGQAVCAVGRFVANLAWWWRRWDICGPVTAILSLGLALLLFAALQVYYANGRAADRLDQTLRVVERHARSGDIILVSPRFFLRQLRVHGAEVVYLDEHLSPDELDARATHYRRVWVLYSSYLPSVELQEPLDRWVQTKKGFVRIPIKSIMAVAMGSLAQRDAELSLQEQIAVLEEMAQFSSGDSEARQRCHVLADVYGALADLYEGRGETGLAAEYRAKSEAARSTASCP